MAGLAGSGGESYRAHDAEELTGDNSPTSPKDIGQTASHGEGDGRGDGPSTDQPGDLGGISQIHANGDEDTCDKCEATGDGADVGECE